eukprot:CAMPEP_0175583498 /NCGR_PEP_ID=MMETSP0096-20121207/48689_1 /TAXON_ID=311494 /ORGANISM="Alexandrium monilatum, Strain CCMP3105" /LENGTH=98 /DNA_ID=CAMNT_0016887215 /DNA_START=6 /DNA_END=300 /DNA_ORIENTATION=-
MASLVGYDRNRLRGRISYREMGGKEAPTPHRGSCSNTVGRGARQRQAHTADRTPGGRTCVPAWHISRKKSMGGIRQGRTHPPLIKPPHLGVHTHGRAE